MAKYFFDFRANNVLSLDEEGEELSDAEAAHQAAVGILAEAIREGFTEGQMGQRIVVEVRDELGAVLEVSAILGSKIFRKQ